MGERQRINQKGVKSNPANSFEAKKFKIKQSQWGGVPDGRVKHGGIFIAAPNLKFRSDICMNPAATCRGTSIYQVRDFIC